MQISTRDIPTVLAPLARKDALSRCVSRHRGYRRLADERELDFLIQPGATTSARREELVLKRGIDDADNGSVIEDEGNRHAKHGEAMSVVDGACRASISNPHCIIHSQDAHVTNHPKDQRTRWAGHRSDTRGIALWNTSLLRGIYQSQPESSGIMNFGNLTDLCDGYFSWIVVRMNFSTSDGAVISMATIPPPKLIITGFNDLFRIS